MTESVSNSPSFVCHSGQLLWGQLHCIAEGYLANDSDALSSLPTPLKGGTIIQHNYKYRVNAARGEWNVKDIIFQSQPDEPSSVAGFIIFNKEIAKPLEILKDCANLGMRSSQDNRIIYINRYDWSWHHEIPAAVERLLNDGNENDELEEKVRNMIAQRIILADVSGGLAIINQLKQKSSEASKNALIKEALTVENSAIGVHLACPHTEYELGWMVFNESNKEELIAFVYDGTYCALEGDITLRD